MRCPKCGCQEDKVIDSRASREGATIRRRRECSKCNHRFTTYEEVEREGLIRKSWKIWWTTSSPP
jgi:transcriptional repressor NrdR